MAPTAMRHKAIDKSTFIPKPYVIAGRFAVRVRTSGLSARQRSRMLVIAERGFLPGVVFYTSSILSSYRGSYIVEYAGSQIGSVRKRELVAKGCVYILQATSNVFVDASKDTPNNIARYINHCCAPNARVEIWEDIAGQARALVIASRRIGAGEEITIDYGRCSCPTNYLPDY
ncbi:hypothetical protein R3P38DRAFT_3361869 [Favolaschia claudopus]|uniref:SET domain-containing protein n=1 Tax=Favolaschia claudopus TaxID=2862362 RepID=A0AAW0AQD6_9AGAR